MSESHLRSVGHALKFSREPGAELNATQLKSLQLGILFFIPNFIIAVVERQ